MSKTLFKEDVYNKLQEAVDLICNAVKVTLGPRGKNVLTIDRFGSTHLTKDGITVAKNVKSEDLIVNGIINIIREASANTAKSAGDGTTTTLVLTQALFNEGIKLIRDGMYNPTLVKAGMSRALDDILKYIKEHSESITLDSKKLEEVSFISANNDTEVGNIAVEAIREATLDGIVNIEDSKSIDTTIKCNNGLTFDKGYVSPHFVTGDKTTIEYDNPLIFVSSIELSTKTIVDLMKQAKDNDKPLVIIAPDFNESIFMSMFKNFKAGAVQVCPIKLPGFAGNRAQWIEDITAYIDNEVYTSNNVNPIKYLGTSDKILISAEETTIVNDFSTTKCESQLCILQSRLLDNIEDTERTIIQNRIARLRGKIVTIFVGATTELELKEKKDRIEDAVCALQTALKGGISDGGGITFLRCGYELYDNINDISEESRGYNAVMNALSVPFSQLCINSDITIDNTECPWVDDAYIGYNFKTLRWENLKENGIIDPTVVLENAITNAVSIVSNLLTTECITYYE